MADALFDKVEALVRVAEGRGFSLVEFAEGALELRITFEASAPAGELGARDPASTPPAKSADEAAVVSPGVGFLRCVHPAGITLPEEGEAVAAGAVVALLQAGPLLQPVTAARAGKLGKRLVADGAGVGFGTALFDLV